MTLDTSRHARTLTELRAGYLIWAERHYRRRSGQPTREHLNMRAAIDRLIRFAGGDSDPAKINRHQIRAWMDQLAAEELTRSYINACLARVRRWVRWAADLDLVPFQVTEDLRRVHPIQQFRGGREPGHQPPPALEQIAQVLPFLTPRARDVLQLCKLTGARPSELLELTNAEIHIDGVGPRITPLQHKNAHRGHQRVIPLTPAAVLVIQRHWRPLLPLDRLFTSSSVRGHYTIEAFRAALARGCKRAGVPKFTPYAVRHAVARLVRRERGLDAAQALLGHANASTTEIYAPLDAREVETFNAARTATEVL